MLTWTCTDPGVEVHALPPPPLLHVFLLNVNSKLDFLKVFMKIKLQPDRSFYILAGEIHNRRDVINTPTGKGSFHAAPTIDGLTTQIGSPLPSSMILCSAIAFVNV